MQRNAVQAAAEEAGRRFSAVPRHASMHAICKRVVRVVCSVGRRRGGQRVVGCVRSGSVCARRRQSMEASANTMMPYHVRSYRIGAKEGCQVVGGGG